MDKISIKLWISGLTGLIFLLVLGSLSNTVLAAPQAQLTPFATPTPGQDGRIIYIVQPNDTLWRISAITGVPLDQLRALNKLVNDIVKPGDQLLIGLGGPSVSQSTQIPGGATAVPALPTPTVQPGSGDICVMLFFDLNGDGMRQASEQWIENGEINVTNRSGSVSKTATTKKLFDNFGDPMHLCFESVPEGEYVVTVAIPQGYNPTMALTKSFKLTAGDTTYLSFGAQLNSEKSNQEAIIPEEPARSPILAIAGGVLLLAAAGLGIYAFVLLRRK